MLELQLGRCGAVVADLPMLAALKGHAERRYGALAGSIRTGEQYGIALPKGSALTARVNTVVKTMIDDGTIANLQRRWLDVDLMRVRALR
jgi:polar amino acid transport system substrate-binding protein